jgi:phage-related holin
MQQVFTSIAHMFEGFSAGTWYGKLAIALGSVLTAFYSPIVALLVCCFAFTAVDMFYGIKVSHKFKRKIESHKSWSGTITKLLDEWIVISLARLLEMSVINSDGVFVLTGGATVIIGLTELWSILENLNTLNPHGPWKALGKFLKKKGEDYIGTEIEINDEHTDDNKLVGSES